MGNDYWDLFWNTGLPAFYLLQKQKMKEEEEELERRTR